MEQREGPEGEVHAQHEELAVREVDDAHHAEDEGEPHRDERVDPAQEDGGDEELRNYVHDRAARRSTDARRPGDGPRGAGAIDEAERAVTSAGPTRRAGSTWRDWS